MIALLSMGIVVSCKDDKEDPKSQSRLEENYFTIENGKYVTGNFPEATSDERITDVEMSDQVMNGAVNFITVTTPYEVKKFFLGIEGVTGYIEYNPESSRASEKHTYVLPLMIAQDYTGDAELVMSAELEDGSITIPSRHHLNYLETRPGALEVKLAFSNEKDIDLHVFTPSGIHIYFNTSEDGYYFGEYGDEAYPFGLDIDSNAGCSIDGTNKENIYIPEEYVENGIYRVAVDLYENCDPSIPTSWSITTRYNGNLVQPIKGENPASGIFRVNAESSYCENLVDVMTFEIKGARQSKLNLDSSRRGIRKKSDLHFSESQLNKILRQGK